MSARPPEHLLAKDPEEFNEAERAEFEAWVRAAWEAMGVWGGGSRGRAH